MRTLVTSAHAGAAIALAVLAFPCWARADDLDEKRRAATAQRRSGDIDIDGIIDEPAWEAATIQGDFWQRDPEEGAPPDFPTEVAILYDDDALYVAVRAHDPHPEGIVGLLTRRDQDSPSDWIGVAIDSYHDHRTAFLFKVNPAGVERDARIHDDNVFDYGWNGVWSSGAAITADGWSAELRIPFSQLRFADTAEPWGLQVSRLVQRTREESYFSPLPKSAPLSWVSRAGLLDGLARLEPKMRLEIRPYLLGGAAVVDAPDGDPFAGDVDGRGSAGIDIKLGLSPAFTLAMALNPDFGQVEADPSVVNLGSGEILFEEKRPFFLEDAELFDLGLGMNDGQTLFYSRRIGAVPHASFAGEGDYVSEPTTTTIDAAAKVSGKTTGGWLLGALTALTAEENARVASVGGPTEAHVVEPLTSYSVVRAGKELRGGKTVIDASATSVVRKVDGTGLAALVPEAAVTGGVGISHRFGHDKWRVDGHLYGSHVRGDADAIARIQRGRYHYFQRPNADHLTYDPARESLTGAGGYWEIGRPGAKTWRFGIGGDTHSPELELSDLGFQNAADYYTQFAWGEHADERPGRFFRSQVIGMDAIHTWEYDGQSTLSASHLYGSAVLKSYWSANFLVGADAVHQQSKLLRGGPAVAGDAFYHASVDVLSDARKPVRGQLSGQLVWMPGARSWNGAVRLTGTVQAASNLDIALEPTVARNVDADQYVTEVVDTGDSTRYILAHIDQITAALTLRVNYTITPDLSLQLYAQPYINTGHYTDYKEPADPGAEDRARRYHIFSPAELRTGEPGLVGVDGDGDGVAEMTFPAADFSFRQLRSNFVVRWEYQPGATLFFIWSHDRTSVARKGRFDLGDDLHGLFGERGEHVVMAKLTYWFGL